MIDAQTLAAHLLEIEAVKLKPSEPFTWSSGWKSPIYCDNRLILSYPALRTAVKHAFVETIRQRFPEANALAGVATGGIAIGALCADLMELPFVYVRPSPKGHGLKNQVEGRVDSACRYVLIEDLVSTGKSSVAALHALREAGGQVLGTVAIFGYGFAEAEAAFAATGTPFYTLSNLEALIQKAAESHYIRPGDMDTILSWKNNPAIWGL